LAILRGGPTVMTGEVVERGPFGEPA
jgi:hypothetical protein